jgi:hypothetical protein
MECERIVFTKSSELYLDAHATLRWQTLYHGTNGSLLTLRTIAQAPNEIVVEVPQ